MGEPLHALTLADLAQAKMILDSAPGPAPEQFLIPGHGVVSADSAIALNYFATLVEGKPREEKNTQQAAADHD